MKPFQAIEKWINEHASASVLRDHVALLKDQITALERQNSELEIRAKNAEARAQSAESQVENLKVALQNANNEVKILRDPPPGGGMFTLSST